MIKPNSILLCTTFLLFLVTAQTARATNVGFDKSRFTRRLFKLDFDLRMQAQVVMLGIAAMSPGRFGGFELHASAAVKGLTLAAGLGYEQVPLPSPTSRCMLQGGYLMAELQFRFMTLISRKIFPWLDPFVSFGGRLGGIGDSREKWFRGAMDLGAGLDIRLAPTRHHPFLTIHYRYEPLLTPNLGARHLILVGIGLRTTAP